MTYNFDPDRWFEIEEAALKTRRAKGEIDDEELARAMADLGDRYEEMLERIDMRHDY